MTGSGGRTGAAAAAGVALLCGCAILAAVLEALLVPLYLGSTPAPVAVVLALASNVVLPRVGMRMTSRALAGVAPFACWLITIFLFGVVARPEGDVILPGGSLQWVSYGVLLGGAVAGTLSVVLALPPRRAGPGNEPVSAGRDRGSPRPAPPARR